MPPGWIHEVYDLIGFGRSYRYLHQEKDRAWRELGRQHRSVNHEYYVAFRDQWNAGEAYPEGLDRFLYKVSKERHPEEGERLQAWIVHDYLDALWDTSPPESRMYQAWFLRETVLNMTSPEVMDWAGLNVLDEIVARQYETPDGPALVWEPEPGLKETYERLRRLVETRTILQLLYMNTKP